ncbi:hypothetical protein GSH10_23110 [Burkholderia pseudomallei]|nr:hypothetical protein T210_0108850 [Burkholderia pseudomallei MSHR6137]MBM5577418.1 hypothetical protein [Burkholderia pseudomallei]MBM5583117.1 hypothetical protein [Burkholderia pseudomallei]MBM5593417.1 hypothetical protein [Burkholderia pseudomallei]RPA10137.1 hypothetical protein EGT86_18620 [Burkholderia pseudomallei]
MSCIARARAGGAKGRDRGASRGASRSTSRGTSRYVGARRGTSRLIGRMDGCEVVRLRIGQASGCSPATGNRAIA